MRYGRSANLCNSFRDLTLKMDIVPSCLKHRNSFIGVHVENNASCCLLEGIQAEIELG